MKPTHGIATPLQHRRFRRDAGAALYRQSRKKQTTVRAQPAIGCSVSCPAGRLRRWRTS